eukprot:5276339-Prymnesium_polylepis.1
MIPIICEDIEAAYRERPQSRRGWRRVRWWQRWRRRQRWWLEWVCVHAAVARKAAHRRRKIRDCIQLS